MKCPRENRQEADLLAFSADRLEPKQAEAIAGHLKACAECREFVEAQRGVWRALDAWEAPAIAPDFDQRLWQRLEQKSGWRDRWIEPVRLALVRRALPVAAVACLIVVAGLVSLRTPKVPPAAEPTTIKVESLRPEQVEHAVDDLQMLSDFTGAARADADEL